MNFVLAILATVLFTVGLRVVGVFASISQGMVVARETASVLNDRQQTDDIKERVARAAAIRMSGVSLDILLRIAIALLLPVIIVVTAIEFNFVSGAQILSAFVSWPFIVGSTVLLIGIMRLGR